MILYKDAFGMPEVGKAGSFLLSCQQKHVQRFRCQLRITL